jgi:hypothetical protein
MKTEQEKKATAQDSIYPNSTRIVGSIWLYLRPEDQARLIDAISNKSSFSRSPNILQILHRKALTGAK